MGLASLTAFLLCCDQRHFLSISKFVCVMFDGARWRSLEKNPWLITTRIRFARS